MILSQNSAQSVVDYLIQKGISPERLVAKGYGETRPIAPNSLPDKSDKKTAVQNLKLSGEQTSIQIFCTNTNDKIVRQIAQRFLTTH